MRQVIYNPGTFTVMDFLKDGKTAIYGKYPDEYPDCEVWSLDAAIQHREDHYRTEPEEITEGDYWDALECLPPEDYRGSEAGESFKMMEYTIGNLTAIYARVGDRYWTFTDSASLTHAEIMARIPK